MAQRLAFALILFALLSPFLLTRFNGVEVKASDGLPVHNITTGMNYTDIQSAINADETKGGDTIMVDEGVYYGTHVFVNKSLTIMGRNMNTTILDGGGSARVFSLIVGNVNITGFTTQNARWAIYISSSGNRVYGNRIRNSDANIRLENASGNLISDNIIEDAKPDGEGVYIGEAGNNTVQRNLIVNASSGIYLITSTRNIIKENTITNCSYGITLDALANNNRLFHNNVLRNSQNLQFMASTINGWDNGYPSGGNYWDDYAGSDFNMSAYQNVTGSDGIGDEPYFIDTYNRDNYPLMAPISVFDAGTFDSVTYYVDVVSNSTVSAFDFKPLNGAFLRFNVTGDDGTNGFCRVTIPLDMLWTEDGWIVYVDGQSVNSTPIRDANSTYLYFTYSHSTKTVEIHGTHTIPEFSTLTIPLLFTTITIIVATACRRKRRTQQFFK